MGSVSCNWVCRSEAASSAVEEVGLCITMHGGENGYPFWQQAIDISN